jgi:hypothetical protein
MADRSRGDDVTDILILGGLGRSLAWLPTFPQRDRRTPGALSAQCEAVVKVVEASNIEK